MQKRKGTHKALNRFREFGYIVSKNDTRTCWILKCDIKKFFASVDQNILIKILENRLLRRFASRNDGIEIINLLKKIIYSFYPNGLPLGNLASQLFANIYLNEFDQFIKQGLKIKYYVRYADDFVIFSDNKKYLEYLLPGINDYLQRNLKLILHPDKIFIKTLYSGMDYLGWINFFDHRVLRTKTKNRITGKLKQNFNKHSVKSYLGLLKHGNCHKFIVSLQNKQIL